MVENPKEESFREYIERLNREKPKAKFWHNGRFLEALTVFFIVLKLYGYITWPWYWVVAPALVIPVLTCLTCVVTFPLILPKVFQELDKEDSSGD